MAKRQFAFAAEKLIKTINFNIDEIRNWEILDSGATSHFLVVDSPVDDVTPTTNPMRVRQPDGTHVQLTHICSLRIPELPRDAQLAHIIPGLASHSLLLVVRLCNAGCTVTFTKIDCVVKYCGKMII